MASKKKEKENFTADRVAGFICEAGKSQTLYWDAKIPGLGLRVSSGGTKSYFFESRLFSKTIRMTIGDAKTWAIDKPKTWPIDKPHKSARSEATRLKSLCDQGIDPRLLKEEQNSKIERAKTEKLDNAFKASVTVQHAWNDYLNHHQDRMNLAHIEKGRKWGDRHLKDHINLSQSGGEPKSRGKGLTVQGVLYPLLQKRMVEINVAFLTEWLRNEAKTRANNARQGFEMFRAFWRWCGSRPEYKAIIDLGAVESSDVLNEVPSRKTKRADVLQRSHLKPWFGAVRSLGNPVIAAYLQGLLLTGARRNELGCLRWCDVDFRWCSIWMKDKEEGQGRIIPLTPYLASLLSALPRRNEWVFSSPTASSGRLEEPRIPHNQALAYAGLPHVSIHGLRRTFKSLSEWVEIPAGVVAQIMGHAPSATAEKHYTNRPLELLATWHVKYESWLLEQAGIEFDSGASGERLRVVI